MNELIQKEVRAALEAKIGALTVAVTELQSVVNAQAAYIQKLNAEKVEAAKVATAKEVAKPAVKGKRA